MKDLEQFEKNINEFLEEHGIRGFLILYFSKYLHSQIEEIARSKGKSYSDDIGVKFYFRGNKIKNKNDLDKFEEGVQKECEKKAKEIVEEIENDDDFTPLFEGDFELLDNEFYEDYFEGKMHDLFEKWKPEERN